MYFNRTDIKTLSYGGRKDWLTHVRQPMSIGDVPNPSWSLVEGERSNGIR